MTKFKNKYRVESIRLPEWDYSQAGYYFVTVCTKNRHPFFGIIVAGDIRLSPIGEIVAQEWARTERVRSYVRLDDWVVMPNHMHMIVVITGNIEPAGEDTFQRTWKTPHRGVSTIAASERWGSGTLGSIIGQFKGNCTRRIKKLGRYDFAWQSRFFDRIIRSDEALQRVRLYIASNPANWSKDPNNPAYSNR